MSITAQFPIDLLFLFVQFRYFSNLPQMWNVIRQFRELAEILQMCCAPKVVILNSGHVLLILKPILC